MEQEYLQPLNRTVFGNTITTGTTAGGSNLYNNDQYLYLLQTTKHKLLL